MPLSDQVPAGQRPHVPPATQEVQAADVPPRLEKEPELHTTGTLAPPVQPKPGTQGTHVPRVPLQLLEPVEVV